MKRALMEEKSRGRDGDNLDELDYHSEDDESEDGEVLVSDRVQLSRSGDNVGKGLRSLPELVKGQKVSKEELFDEAHQLELGPSKKGRMMIDELEFEEDDDEDEAEEDDDQAESDEENVIIKAAPSFQVNPQHVRNQRRLESDLLGIRIRMQPLLNQLENLTPEASVHARSYGALKDVLIDLLDIQQSLFGSERHAQNFSFTDQLGPSPNAQARIGELFRYLQLEHEVLWKQHRAVIESWERRATLYSTRQKELKVANKSAVDQTLAAMERRKELNKAVDFAKEDSGFYSQMLRDFVHQSAKLQDSQASANGTKSKVDKRKARYGDSKKDRDSLLNYQVHEKLVNFVAPTPLPKPSLDIDQLVKSLFK